MALTNNDIFKKLRVAHHLTNDDIVEICLLVDFRVSKSELGAIFRREDHPKYKECGDQFLRNFLDGLIVHMRGPELESKKGKPRPKKDFKKTSYRPKEGGEKEFKKPYKKFDKPFKARPKREGEEGKYPSKKKDYGNKNYPKRNYGTKKPYSKYGKKDGNNSGKPKD